MMKLHLYRYKFPFKNAFKTAQQTFEYREGLYLVLQKNDMQSLGEAAPVPGFSKEDLPTVQNQAQNQSDAILDFLRTSFSVDDVIRFLESAKFCPSLQFSLFTVAAGLLAQQHNMPLHKLLFEKHAVQLPINAVIGKGDHHSIARLQQNQYQTVKIKSGKNWQQTVQIIKKIRKQSNNINIRIDANQSWSLEQAQKCLQQLEPYSIEYCEEPLSGPSTSSLYKLQQNTSIPIALDESLASTFSLQQAAELASVLIIKPMVMGLPSFNGTLRNIAHKHDCKLVFTTGLESGAGRLMTAALAAGLGSSGTAHGLATGHLLKNDFWRDDDFIKDGNYIFPTANQLTARMNTNINGLAVKKVASYE